MGSAIVLTESVTNRQEGTRHKTERKEQENGVKSDRKERGTKTSKKE